MNVLTGESKAQEAIQHAPQGDIIAAAEALAGADTIINGTDKEYRLKEALDRLLYEYIVIDTPTNSRTK